MSGGNAASVVWRILWLWILLLPMVTLSATNSPNESETTLDPIAVKGISGARRITGELIGKIIAEYERLKPEFAPESSLKFVVTKKLKSPVPDSSINLFYYYGDTFEKQKLDVNDDGSFLVSQIPYEEYPKGELLTNRKSEYYWFDVFVVTPGLGRGDVRVGDFRLKCHLGWMLNKSEYSMTLQAKAILLGGACEKGLMPNLILKRHVRSVEILGVPKNEFVYSVDANVVRINHHNINIKNDAIFHIEYIDE